MVGGVLHVQGCRDRGTREQRTGVELQDVQQVDFDPVVDVDLGQRIGEVRRTGWSAQPGGLEHDTEVGTDTLVSTGDGTARQDTGGGVATCLLYTSPSPRDGLLSRMPSSA